MSSSPIPKTAPFAEEEIELLNRVVGPASATQRAWLAGFLAGIEVTGEAAVAAPAPAPAAEARPAEPLTILYATESGNAEKLAGDLAQTARKTGLKPTLVDMADLDLATIASSKRLVVIASTWGEGDPPARAARGYADLMNDPTVRLEGIEYGVLAFGDTAFTTLRQGDRRTACRARRRRVVERIDCDLDFAEPAAKWIGEAVKALAPPEPARGTVIAVDFGTKQASAGAVELGPVAAEITEHINLNSSRSDKETVHIELAFEGAAPAYKPGDSLDVFPENDPAYVERC
jgi:sulfite reductase (NADPH) flavoprotein alpha-component